MKVLTNIGIIGDFHSGKVELLRFLVDYIKGGTAPLKAEILKTEFIEENSSSSKYLDTLSTKTIRPHRVVFKDLRTGKAHTLYASGGGDSKEESRMAFLTITRISSRVVMLFSLNHDLESQFEILNEGRFLPREIPVGVNTLDLLGAEERIMLQKEAREKIMGFFQERKIHVSQILFLSTITGEGLSNFMELVISLMRT